MFLLLQLLCAPLLHGLAEAVVWHELVTRKALVCARRAKPSLPEPVLDGSAAVGVAVQGDNWVNHLLLGDWAHKGLCHRIVFFHPSVPWSFAIKEREENSDFDDRLL